MSRLKKSSSYVAPFCRQSWKIPAAMLVLLFLATLAWGWHLVRDHANMLGLEIANNRAIVTDKNGHVDPVSAIGVAFKSLFTGQAGLSSTSLSASSSSQPAGQAMPPVRAALVNIAGLTKASTGGISSYVTAGSGVVVSPKGYVVTAMHLIQNLADIYVRVQTPLGPRQYPAKMVKVVAEHDLALLKIVSQDPFPYLAIDVQSTLRVGDAVQAWGDPMGKDAIQRVGKIEGVDLTTPVMVQNLRLTHLIRTSAVFNWAQSGGPLINSRDRVVGVNLALEDGSSGRVLGYAIPSNLMVTHFQELVNFVQTPQNAMMTAPGVPRAQPVQMTTDPAMTEAAPLDRPAREPRMADRWWQKVQGFLLAGLGQHVAAVPMPAAPTSAVMMATDPSHAPTFQIWGYSLGSFAGLLLLGFISGVSGGMMTMGGGIIKVTGLMWFFGYGLLLVRPVAYVTNIFMYGAAALRYRREGLLRFELCKPLIPWAMAGMVLGYFIGNIMSKTAIQWLLGLFALLLGIKMLVELSESYARRKVAPELFEEDDLAAGARKQQGVIAWLQRYFGSWVEEDARKGTVLEDGGGRRQTAAQHGLLGLPMGLISGILGITGGVIEVPLQRYIAGMPMRNAIANSATLVFFSSLVGSAVALFHGVQSGSFELQTPLIMALILTPGAFLGGMAGAWFTSVVPLNVLRWIYAVLMFVIAGRMFWS
ncbi:MAG: TSUP family transporter [Magnetococcales bacterium]|nr:TSUP family transporter [Magnetococcales bacterium]